MGLIETILFVYFAVAVAYTAIFSIAGKASSRPKFQASARFNSIVVLVPCYKEDSVILSVAKRLTEIDYPKDKFDIVIIADGLQPSTIKFLSFLAVTTIPVKFERSTKTNSLNFALNHLNKVYDIAIINDADNIPAIDFLKNINDAYNAGHRVIQAQRVAKNLNSPFAVLDAASEIINNHLFRKGANALGLSSSIIGSGMAYPYTLLKEELGKVDAVGGFDKVLQLSVIEQGIKILYLEGTLIFDEKIESAQAFRNQRKRWISSQLIYWKMFFSKGFSLLRKGNIDYFNLAVIYNLFPPRVILFATLTFVACALTIFHSSFLAAGRWWGLLIIYVAALLIALPIRFYDKKFFVALTRLPFAVFQVICVLFRLKGANQKFIHTAHSVVEVENTIYSSDGK